MGPNSDKWDMGGVHDHVEALALTKMS